MKAARFLQIRGLVEVDENQLKEQNAARLTSENKTKELSRKRQIVQHPKEDFLASDDYDTDDSVIYQAPAVKPPIINSCIFYSLLQ